MYSQLCDRSLIVCHLGMYGWVCAHRHLTAVSCVYVYVTVSVMVSDNCYAQVLVPLSLYELSCVTVL